MNPPGASGGTNPKLYLWNCYNRVLTRGYCLDNGATYTYTPSTWRIARGSGSNLIGLVSGLPFDAIAVTRSGRVDTTAVANSYAQYGVGLDGPSPFSSRLIYAASANAFRVDGVVAASIDKQIGYHQIQMVEWGDGANANSFYGGGDVTALFPM
jgi:hypothetical protein